MVSNLGFVSLVFALILSLLIVVLFLKHSFLKSSLNQENFILFYNISFFLILSSFVLLIVSFVLSDFSIISVYENSHTDKPLFYKISGTWQS